MLGVRVDRREAEEIRRILASAGVIDTTRAIIEHGDCVLIPVTAIPSCRYMDGYECEAVSQEFPSRLKREDPIDEIRRAANVPDDLKYLLPDKWELLGDVLVIRIPNKLEPYEKAIAETYAKVLGVKSVLRDMGGVTGEFRTPVMKKILGSDTVAVHKENGVLFKLDVSQIMFSSGNIDERMRASRIACDNEVVVDMFAGIGYFSIPIAVHQSPRRVIACELNPVAFAYLVENIDLNSVRETVEPIRGDNRNLEGESIADRVFMGYVKTTHEYLRTAIRLIRDGGVIHYHETCPCELLPDRPICRLRSAAGDDNVEVLGVREVKSYSPGVSHIVVDARILKSG
ncbi:MAG: class I SAM-dependent methyltransferase family protein [Methanobacteriota archaeon]|nr:MAG: class I SAM-dependent methyltransferase family protein [Euryarchaeota archaeon]